MIRDNETNLHPRPEQADESQLRCDAITWPHARRLAVGFGCLALMVVAAGCSGDDSNPATGTGASGGSGGAGGSGGNGGAGAQDADDPDGYVICPIPGDPIDSYHANLVKPGTSGVLTFTLVQSDHAPPIRADNAWQLKITKADMTPVTGEVTGEVKMPRHIHAAGRQPDITYDSALGLYRATPVSFSAMPGYWGAWFTAYEAGADAGNPLDIGVFYFCVE